MRLRAPWAIKGNWRLDDTIQNKIVAMAFSMAAEIERDLISARTTEALRARKASGLPLGRPKGPGKSKLDQFRPEIEALLANGSTQAFIAKRYGTTPANLSNWIRKHGITRPTPCKSCGGFGSFVGLNPICFEERTHAQTLRTSTIHPTSSARISPSFCSETEWSTHSRRLRISGPSQGPTAIERYARWLTLVLLPLLSLVDRRKAMLGQNQEKRVRPSSISMLTHVSSPCLGRLPACPPKGH